MESQTFVLWYWKNMTIHLVELDVTDFYLVDYFIS